MGNGNDKLLVWLGLAALAHAGYSAAQHRAYIRLTERHFTALPADILFQCVVGLVLACAGIVRLVGELKSIHTSGELQRKGHETLSNAPSFYAFNHRGQTLFSQGD